MQEITLSQIAQYVNGSIHGNPDVKIKAAATLSQAGKGDISFLSNRKYYKQLLSTNASAVIVGQKIDEVSLPLLITEDPYYAFMQVMVLLYGHRKHKNTGISLQASISETAVIGSDCHIAANAVIADDVKIGSGCIIYPGTYIAEKVQIGDHCIMYPNVVIYDGCKLGNRVIVNANTTIGEDGFGFATHNGVHYKIPQTGIVIIEDDVEIGSGCAIERGTLSDTVIGKGSKLGDLIAIGHGTIIGPNCLLVAQSGIAGSTTIGHHCTVGGQVGIVGHINIGNNVTIAAQSGVINNISDNMVLLGAPAIEAEQGRRAYSMIQYLPEMKQCIRELQNQVAKLRANNESDSQEHQQ